MAEYFDFACKWDVLAAFFERAPAGVLRHKLCDLAFTQRLKQMQRAPLEVKPPEDEWVYFYSTRQTAVSGCLPRDD